MPEDGRKQPNPWFDPPPVDTDDDDDSIGCLDFCIAGALAVALWLAIIVLVLYWRWWF
jgi:hypothetical protein